MAGLGWMLGRVTVCAWMRGEGREMGLVVEKGSEMSKGTG
jgi:hypothetical protein